MVVALSFLPGGKGPALKNATLLPLVTVQEKAHLGMVKGIIVMQNLRVFGLVGLGVVALTATAVLTVSLTLIAGAVLTGTLAWRILTLRPKPAPVHARSRKDTQPMRIWNDGHGTIIDM